MALINIPFKAGIFTEATDREVGKLLYWKDGDKVRFFNGKPQKLGGWVKAGATQFVGKARAAIDWVTTRQEKFTAVGTHKKLYVWQGGTFYDITPIRDSGNLTNPFSTVINTPTVTVSDTAHGNAVGDYVHYSGASAVGGITINGEYTVTSVIGPDSYTITHTANATSTAGPGGGTVAYQYEINTGNEYAVSGLGWSTGKYGVGTWGTPRVSSGLLLQSRTWSLAIYGEDLIACPYGGAIYTWDSSLGVNTRATIISQAPQTNKAIFVMPDERQIVALGAYHDGANDPLYIRWCVSEDYTNWTPALGNTAGDQIISNGSELLCGIPLKNETLVHTDSTAYSMVLVGLPDIYGFTPIGSNGGLLGQHAAIACNGISYWMTKTGFYKYDGVIAKIPCPVHDKVFNDINFSSARHFYAALNLAFGEVWWLYASASSQELDSYVIYNLSDSSWAYGKLARTAFVADSKFTSSAYAFGTDGYMYQHESGVDADGSALESYLESGDVEVDNVGDFMMHIGKFIPDMLILDGELDVTFTGKKYPQDSEVQTSGPHAITSGTEFVNPRLRCRQISLKLESSNVGDNWRLGMIRVDAKQDGKR